MLIKTNLSFRVVMEKSLRAKFGWKLNWRA